MTLRISIATALLVTGLVAAILAGFRFGVDRGREVASVELDQAEPRSGAYDLSGVRIDSTVLNLDWPGRHSPQKGDLISRHIQENFAKDDWGAVGGPFSISYDQSTDKLSAFCRGSTHDMISAFLDEVVNDSSRLTDIAVEYHEEAARQHERTLTWAEEKLSHAQSKIDDSVTLGSKASKFVGAFRNEALGTLHSDVTAFVFYPEPNTANSLGGMLDDSRGFVQLVRPASIGGQSKLKFSMYSEHNLAIGNNHFVVGTVGDDVILVMQNDPSEALRLKPMDSMPGEQ